MLEIIFLVIFGRRLAKTAREKGHSAGWGALALLWIVGELIGFFLAGMLGIGSDILTMYPLAILCAIGGAVAAWLIVKSLPDRHASNDDDDGGGAPPVENRHYDPANPFSPPRKG